MAFDPSSPEFLSPRQLLQGEVLDAHKEAALASYREFGLDLETWDPQLIDDFMRTDSGVELSQHVIGCVDFDPEAHPKPTHEGSILGYSHFVLIDSATPTDYLAVGVGEKNENYARESVEAPVKRIRVRLLTSPEDVATEVEGLIFVAPGMTPSAVHMDDVNYAALQEHNRYDDWNLGAVDKVAALFGDEAVDRLSDATCQVLINAVQSSDVRAYVEP